jgi:hypothetical protein
VGILCNKQVRDLNEHYEKCSDGNNSPDDGHSHRQQSPIPPVSPSDKVNFHFL